MKCLGESNCLVFNNLSEDEFQELLNKTEDYGWLDLEERFLFEPARYTDDKEWFNKFFGQDVYGAQFVICILNEQ